MATIKDVAKAAGVSPATVSRVLNNTAPVNAQTRQIIERVIKDLNYQPSVIARGMRNQESKILAVLIPSSKNPFHITLFEHMEHEARQHGYRIILVPMDESKMAEQNSIMDMMARNVDGIILCTYRGDKKGIKDIIDVSKKLPIIFMDKFEFDEDINAVYINEYEGIQAVTNHLISLGHTRIGYIGKVIGYQVANERLTAYMETLEANGIAYNPSLVYGGNYEINSGYEAAEYFMTQCQVKPTAIISSNDAMGVGVVGYLKEHGYKIPTDVAVTGFDDIFVGKIIEPALTTYRQPLKTIASQVIKLLINKIKTPELENKKVLIEGKLIIRGSTIEGKQDKVFPIIE